MLPSYKGQKLGGSPKANKRLQDDTPWLLVMLVVFSGSCLVFTRQRSLREQDIVSAYGGYDVNTLQRQRQRGLQEEPTEPSEPAENQYPYFDPVVHDSYTHIPPLPEATHEILKGGWQLTPEIYDLAAHHPSARILSWEKPRLVLFPSFLTPQEINHFLESAMNQLSRSEVLSADEGNSVDDARTSFGAWPKADDVLRGVEDRVHRLLGIPQKFGEDFYVLSYKLGEKYSAHNDHCMDNQQYFKTADKACVDFLKRSGGPECGAGKGGPTCGDRVATFIIYLKSPLKGGKTVFPQAEITAQRVPGEVRTRGGDEWYCNDENDVLGGAPNPGDALLFWDYRPGNGTGRGSYENGTGEPEAEPVYEALHSGCPVVEGEKWIVTRWIRASGFDYFG